MKICDGIACISKVMLILQTPEPKNCISKVINFKGRKNIQDFCINQKYALEEIAVLPVCIR